MVTVSMHPRHLAFQRNATPHLGDSLLACAERPLSMRTEKRLTWPYSRSSAPPGATLFAQLEWPAWKRAFRTRSPSCAQALPEVAAIHPFKLVPCMRHGDLALAESRAICTYIDQAFDGPPLVPTGSARSRHHGTVDRDGPDHNRSGAGPHLHRSLSQCARRRP